MPARQASVSAAGRAGVDAAWRAWWERNTEEIYQDPEAVKRRLEADYTQAQRSGDLHRAWMDLAWLADLTPWKGDAASESYTAQAEKAIVRARAAGDRAALYDLVTTVEWARVLANGGALRASLVGEAQAAASALGDPMRDGMLERLRGLAAAAAGLHGEAVGHFRLALATVSPPALHAGVLCLLARSLAAVDPSADARQAAEGYLKDAAAEFDPRTHPLFVMPDTYRVPIYLELGEPERAVGAAREAVGLLDGARAGAAESERARIDLARALLAAGRAPQALAELARMNDAAESSGARLDLYLVRAEVLATLGQPDALEDLARAERLVAQSLGLRPEAQRLYHETASRVYRLRGDLPSAIAEMTKASLARQRRDQQATEQLIQARLDEGKRQQEYTVLALRDSAGRQQRWLLGGGLVLAAAGLVLVGIMTLGQLRQRRLLIALSGRLERANGALAALHAARVRLLEAACRDLRQPVHALGMLAAAAGQPSAKPAIREGQLDDIHRCSRMLVERLDDLMDVSRLESGSYVARLGPVVLGRLLEELRGDFQEAAQRRGVELDVQATTAVSVRSDPQLLRRMLSNLLVHALEDVRAGTLTVHAVEGDGRVALTVAASESGLTQAQFEARFDVAASVDAAASFGDLGLGLSIVKFGAELLGHPLQLRSAPGRGSAVTLTLDTVDDASRARRPAPRRGRGEWVAVLDDDESILRATDALLCSQGYRVVTAIDAEALLPALERAGATRPDLLIADLHLGGLDGLEQVALLRSRPGWEGLPALLLTGDLDPQVLVRAAAMNVAVSHKPLRPAHLALRLRELLEAAQ